VYIYELINHQSIRERKRRPKKTSTPSCFPPTLLQLPLSQARSATSLRSQRLNIPDTLSILIDATITAEEAHASNTHDALRNPFILILVRNIHKVLSLNVAVEVI
jgi:hypothetical protein